MWIGNMLGTLLGYPLGTITGTISFLRDARMFHPSGRLVKCKVHPLKQDLYPFALLRLSSALWKRGQSPDVLGLAMRLSSQQTFTEFPQPNDQDLLFASFPHPWQTPYGPLLTKHWDFFSNTFFTVCPFMKDRRKVTFRLVPMDNFHHQHLNRDEILTEWIAKNGSLSLEMKDERDRWERIATIELVEEVQLNQDILKFNPFLNGLGITPTGFIQHLRIGAYSLSQFGRSVRNRQKILHHFNNRFIVHRFRHITKSLFIDSIHHID